MNRILFVKSILEREGVSFEFIKSPPFPDYKGSYILLIEIDRDKSIKIGKLGEFNFKKGLYLYVGSAKGGIDRRVNRYFKERRKHWHIDYLLEEGEVVGLFSVKGIDEEDLCIALRKYLEEPIKGFGSSDKRSFSHLFII